MPSNYPLAISEQSDSTSPYCYEELDVVVPLHVGFDLAVWDAARLVAALAVVAVQLTQQASNAGKEA